MEAGELKRTIGRRVQALREQQGLTQEALAEQIGRSTDTVANIERGANSTRIEVFARLAEVLQVSLPELFEVDPEPAVGRDRRRQVRDLSRLLSAQDDRTLALLSELVRTGLALKAG